MLVFFNGLDPQSVFGENCFIAWSVTWRRKEFEVSLSSTEKIANSVKSKQNVWKIMALAITRVIGLISREHISHITDSIVYLEYSVQ